MIKTIIRFPFVVLVLIAVGLGYNDYRTWQTESHEPLLAEISAREHEIAAKRAEVERARAFEQEKTAKLRELEQLAARVEAMRAEMPRNSSVPDILKFLADTSDKTGLEFSTFKPVAQERREFIVATPIEVVLKGTYVQIMSFLDTAANLPRIVSAQSLKIEMPGNLRTTANILTASARLVTYHLDENYVPDSGADRTDGAPGDASGGPGP